MAAPKVANGAVAADEGVRDAHILIIDDEPANTALLERALRRSGFTRLRSVNTATAAVTAFDAQPPDLLLLDVHLRGADGLQLLGELRAHAATCGTGALLPVIVITGDPSAGTRERARELGAGDFLTKPFDLVELVLRAESLLALRMLHAAISSDSPAVDASGSSDAQERALLERLVEVCAHFDDAPDGHDERVGELSLLLALELGLDVEEADRIGMAARLHDVGKIAVRGEILAKSGPLTDFETDIARRHTLLGALMLSGSRLPLLRLAEQIALSHHERWDGSGYPDRRDGMAIPLAARIVAVADVFDALIHQRAYKPAWPLAAAVAEVGLQRGRHFDPAVVDAFLRIVQRGQLPLPETSSDWVRSHARRPRGGSLGLVRARSELHRLGLVGHPRADVA